MDKKEMNRVIIFITLICCAMYGNSQSSPMVLTLQKAVDTANENSIEAFRSQNSYLAKFWEYKNYRARRLPELTLNATPIQYNRDIVQRYVSETDRIEYRTQRSLYSYGNVSLTQNLDWTGGTLFIDSELGFFRNFGQTITNQYSSVPIRFGYSQSLLGYNPFKWERKIEPIKYKLAGKELYYDMGGISVSVVNIFFSLALAESARELAKKNMESCMLLHNEANERHKQKAISSTELLSIELALIDAQNDMVICENTYSKAMFALVSFLNIHDADSLNVSLPDTLPTGFIDRDLALFHARMNHPVYDEQRQKIFEARQNVDKTRTARFMEASINLSVGFNQVSDELETAYRHPLQQDVVSMGLKIPLVDWGVRRGNYKMAQNNLKIAESAARQEEQAVEEELISTVNDYNAQVQVCRASIRAVRLAEQVCEESLTRFHVGRDNIHLLLDNMLKVKEAQSKYIHALHACWYSYYRIRQMTAYDFQHNRSTLHESM